MNEKEKNASIEYILTQGLVCPQTTPARILEMFRTMGFRYIFWDTGYSLFFTAITLAAALVLFVAVPNDYRYSAAVTVAPLLFLLITVFVETSERACVLYELTQTCRYTIRQITALRVLCYSIAGAVFTAIIAVINARDVYEFFSIFTLCLSALFVCAALSLAVIRFMRNNWLCAAFSAVWIFVNIALSFSFNKRWETFLSGVPIAISAIIAIIGAALFVYQISKMLSEVEKYAVA
jgi:hypothetical protein